MSPPENLPNIEALQAAVAADPQSLRLREELLMALSDDPHARADGRHTAAVRWFVRNLPDRRITRTPVCFIDPRAAPQDYQAVKDTWAAAVAQQPDNPKVWQGFGAFLAAGDYAEAKLAMQRATELAPSDADTWKDLGRVCREPLEQLAAFRRVRELGEADELLLHWLGEAALRAGELDEADSAANELIRNAQAHRELAGEAITWSETGRALWQRARAQVDSDTQARQRIHAISQHAVAQHYGHTLAGAVACRRGEVADGLAHFGESLAIASEHRLSAYGPHPTLVHALAQAGQWQPALAHIRAQQHGWRDYGAEVLERWAGQLQRQEVPGERGE